MSPADRRFKRLSQIQKTGFPATGFPATGFPATGFPARMAIVSPPQTGRFKTPVSFILVGDKDDDFNYMLILYQDMLN
ncbi:MAG: hypothetical protein ACLFUB_13170 [Cyclobacteriaceae bacterium]